MEGQGSPPAIRVPILAVRSALPHLDESQALQEAGNLALLENRNLAHQGPGREPRPSIVEGL